MPDLNIEFVRYFLCFLKGTWVDTDITFETAAEASQPTTYVNKIDGTNTVMEGKLHSGHLTQVS